MQTVDPDAAKRWQSISEFYAEFAQEKGWEFLQPMIELTAWIGYQPFGDRLYPCTSHHWLCVRLFPEFNLEQPFFGCVTKADGQFECRLRIWNRLLIRQSVPLDQAKKLFTEYSGKLIEMSVKGISRDTVTINESADDSR